MTHITSQDVRKQIQFHSELNPIIWDGDKLLPDVQVKLLQTALAFYKYLDVEKLLILDIVITGSNAGYNYTKMSDIDVHLIADFTSANCPKLADNLFLTKKALWIDTYNIDVKGISVEVYVEDADKPANSKGLYSIIQDKWLKKPEAENPDTRTDDDAVVRKTEFYAARIDALLASNPSPKEIKAMIERVKNLRQNGLEHGGEFSTENLTFKSLRALGLLDKLWDTMNAVVSKNLSLEEGHGHIIPRNDGVRVRCGGPRICRVCQQEQESLKVEKAG